MATGKAFSNIGYAIEVNIVEHNEFVVARRNNVLFQIVSAHGVREGLAGQRMLGQVA
jgi:hypothetical protein